MITTGTSKDSAPTGLAGRMAAAIKAAFPGTVYPDGSVGVVGLDAMAKGLVDALNGDKVDGPTQTTGGSAAFSALPLYGSNAAAIAGGLAVGQLYRDGGDPDHVCVVH